MASARFNLYAAIHKDVAKPTAKFLVRRRPQVLYHYTGPAGLLGIVNNGTMYLSDALFLNDQSELAYGRSVITQVIRERLRLTTDKAIASILEEVTREFDSTVAKDRVKFRFYVASFCERGNVLSQWRAYGIPGSGFSIGFRSRDLISVATKFDPTRGMALHRVIYERRRQEALISLALDHACHHASVYLSAQKSVETHHLADCAAAIVFTLAALIPNLKHPVFAEEREWRLIYAVVDLKPSTLKFRHVGRNLTPYLEISVKMLTGKRAGRLSLHEITHAPTPEPDLKKLSLDDLLAANGYPKGEVAVAGSDIPLRVGI